MMAEVALTRIEHGAVNDNGDNEVTVFEEGEEVTGLDEDAMDELRANGAVGDTPETPETLQKITELESEIEALRGQLAASQAGTNVDGTTTVAEGAFRANMETLGLDPEEVRQEQEQALEGSGVDLSDSVPADTSQGSSSTTEPVVEGEIPPSPAP
jgi:hypothetical protein